MIKCVPGLADGDQATTDPQTASDGVDPTQIKSCLTDRIGGDVELEVPAEAPELLGVLTAYMPNDEVTEFPTARVWVHRDSVAKAKQLGTRNPDETALETAGTERRRVGEAQNDAAHTWIEYVEGENGTVPTEDQRNAVEACVGDTVGAGG